MKGFGELYKSTKKSNKKAKPSEKEILQKAFNFHSQGNILEAAKYYKYCINQGCQDQKVFNNYGVLLKNLGKLQEAELSIRKAIEINPDYAEAHANLGNILKGLGKLQEAELFVRKAIKINPDYGTAHYNLGIILNNLGKLEEAELSTRKAIEINPDYAEAHASLSIVLNNLGKLQEAELSVRKAIEINPNYADAHSNLGNILKGLDKLQEAELSTRKAIEVNPSHAQAHYNLGIILSNLGNPKEAFDYYLKAIGINPKISNIYASLSSFLRGIDPSQLNKSKLKTTLNILIDKNDIPHDELFSSFKYLYKNTMINNIEKLETNFSKIEILLDNKIINNALKKIIFRDLELEKALSRIRRNICKFIAYEKEYINQSVLEFLISLGEQCFINEYVYELTAEDKLYIKQIIEESKINGLNEANIAIMSCYYPLYKLLDQIPSLESINSSNKSFKELIKLQITEPLKEIELIKNIKKLGSINDMVSQKVKSQYEENPYPRWRYGKHLEGQKISFLQSINNDIKPNLISPNVKNSSLKILVAGCGTGQHILNTTRYQNAQITAIDLSLSSLAYAQRKINELKIKNVELIQMDILKVNLLEMQFDIIESSGVIHHMDDPLKGLQALIGVLKNNGFLKLGLYSELARQKVIEARNYIANKKLQPNEENIRNCRQKIISGELKDLKSLTKFDDFYSLSEFRDLCFHSQEHRFTINQLGEILKSNKLKFLGFLLPQSVKSIYENYFPEDTKQINLQNWGKLEERYPQTFAGMYQFWVTKISH